jgi:hypothetical protein
MISLMSQVLLLLNEAVMSGQLKKKWLYDKFYIFISDIQKYSFLWAIVEILFLWGLDKMNSKYDCDRLVFSLCSSRLKIVFQVSYKFAYKSKVWAITK